MQGPSLTPASALSSGNFLLFILLQGTGVTPAWSPSNPRALREAPHPSAQHLSFGVRVSEKSPAEQGGPSSRQAQTHPRPTVHVGTAADRNSTLIC